MKNTLRGAWLMSALLLATSAAHAVVTSFASRAAFDAAYPGSIVETWDGYASGTTFANGSTVNGITYNSSSGSALVTNVFLPSSSPNTLGNTTIGFFDAADTMTFTFGRALTAFGIDVNTFATAAGAYTATTNLGDIINSVFDPFPGFRTGEFVGFSSSAPFTSVTLAAASGFTYTLDSLRAVALPEPGALSLLGVCLAVLCIGRRRAAK